MGPTSEDRKYAICATELRAGGAGQRKRRRDGGHVPAWGDARWDHRVRDLKDGRWDLVEARGMHACSAGVETRAIKGLTYRTVAVTEARRTIAHVTRDTSRPATFPADDLRYVPRKRHNSRVPIDPPKTSAPMIADDQPLIVFDEVTLDLDALAEEAVVKQADDKQMRRRSTRRLSRRISLAPIAEADGEAPALTLSPAKAAVPYATPLKRRSLAKMTPRKVAMSPVKLFTVSATPEHVVVEKRDAPLSPVEETTMTCPPVSSPAAAPMVVEALAPLIFDQPVPDVEAEPEHETKRRASLHKARRSLRRSSGVVRVADFATVKVPNRRHSFLPRGLDAGDSKGRRHTLDLTRTGGHDFTLHVTPPSDADGVTERERDEARGRADEAECKDACQRAPAVSRETAVYVDVRTNLDIFGQWQTPAPEKMTPSSPSSEISGRLTTTFENPASPSRGKPTDISSSATISNGNTSALTPTKSSPADTDTPQTGTIADSPTEKPRDDQLLDNHVCPSSSADIEAKAEAMGNTLSKLKPFSSSPPTGTEVDSGLLASLDAEAGQIPADAMTDSDLASDPIGNNPATCLGPIASGSGCVKTENALHILPADSNAEQDALSITDTVTTESEVDGDFTTHAQSASVSTKTLPSAEASLSGEAGRVHQSDASTGSITSANLDTDAHEAASLPREESPANSESVASDLSYSPIQESDDTITVGQNYEPTLPMVMENTITTAMSVDVCSTEATPPPVGAAEPERLSGGNREQAELIFSTPPSAGGFTPINGRSSLSPKSTPPPHTEGDDTLTTSLDVDPLGPDEEDTTATLAIADETKAPQKRLSLQEDSETEMLRKFVTRVRADKTAKEAAAAASRAQLKRPKRRSGSTGSVGTTSSGSPMARNEAAAAAAPPVAPSASAPARRLPLGEKDLNMSPSPVKKRKAHHHLDEAAAATIPAARLDRAKSTTKSSLLSKPDLEDTSPPRPKRRRRKMEAEDADSVFNPEFAARQTTEEATVPAPRRSTRTRAPRQVQPLKPMAPTANALSLIPVRLPGSLNLGGADDAFATTRGEEKDLAAVTRVNTRKNKAGSEPVRVVLERLATDPARRYKELKSVFEAREAAAAAAAAAAASGDDSSEEIGSSDSSGKTKQRRRMAGGPKSVRWDSVLARVQGEDEPLPPPVPQMVVMQAVTRGLEEPVESTAVVDADMADVAAETLELAVVPRDAEDDTKKPAPEEKKPAVRRTRASRLQPPTPRKAIAGINAATPLPAKPTAAAAAAAAKEGKASAGLRMTTRRTKIATLGMSGNGTPAPKRRSARTGI